MKTCPTCQTPVFDDMPRCFSCLFNFEDASNLDESFLSVDDPPPLAHLRKTPDGTEGRTPIQQNAEMAPCLTSQIDTPDIKQEAQAQIQPRRVPPGEWVLRLEIRSAENPAQVWSMELSPVNWQAASA
ncbi:MAG: hypothetical protein IKV48_07975 [Eggerthellaceae bacterium]|nr:hypothetical protein [Eggerthellaceae bacterium]